MKDTGPCDAQAVLTQAEMDVVDALPNGAHETARELACELEAAHPGPHLALAQAYGNPERARWLRWRDDSTHGWLDIEDGEHCNAVGPVIKSIGENAMCLLPGAHPGRHSFEFGILT